MKQVLGTIDCFGNEYICNSSTRNLVNLPAVAVSQRPVITDYLAKQLAEYINLNLETGPWLAGGSVRKMITEEEIGLSDLDIWCSSDSQLAAVYTLLSEIRGVSLMHTSDNAVTFKESHSGRSIQLITRSTYSSAASLISAFDFTCCQLVTDGYNLYYGDRTVCDLESKTLRLANPDNLHCGLLRRVVKYVTYGFKLDADSYNQIVTNIDKISEDGDEY